MEINEVIMQLGEDCNNNNYLSEEYEIMEAYAAIFPEARNVLKWDNEKMEDVSGEFLRLYFFYLLFLDWTSF